MTEAVEAREVDGSAGFTEVVAGIRKLLYSNCDVSLQKSR